jgi:SAM-dependent methyltransferase
MSCSTSDEERKAAAPSGGRLTAVDDWEEIWTGLRLPRRVRSWNESERQLIGLLHRQLPPPPSRLLEVGCAGSAWLPYINRRYGLEVWGIDFSPAGCEMARSNLELLGSEGEVICGDFLSEGVLPEEHFDVVVSFGVVEHFEDTTEVLRGLARFIRPGGRIVTVIPNMESWLWRAGAALEPAYTEQHHCMDPESLGRSHEKAGLEILVPGRRMGGFSLWQLPWGRILPGRTPSFLRRIFGVMVAGANLVMTLPLRLPAPWRGSRRLSSEILVVARKPG